MYIYIYILIYTGHTQKNGAVSLCLTFETAPFFCVYPVYTLYFDNVYIIQLVNSYAFDQIHILFCLCDCVLDLWIVNK
jgi:hypothetical protein